MHAAQAIRALQRRDFRLWPLLALGIDMLWTQRWLQLQS